MFISVREQGRRRRSNPLGVSKAARSSKLSLLSAITSGSHGSNDSASTITQESYKKSSTSSARSVRTSKKKRKSKEAVTSRKAAPEMPATKQTTARSSVDVFSFLVDEDNQTSSTPQINDDTVSKDVRHVVTEDSDNESSAVRSLHSDSGISMTSTHAPLHTADMGLDERLPTLQEVSQESTDNEGQFKERHTHIRRLKLEYPVVPRATHQRHKCRSPEPSPTSKFRRGPSPNEADKFADMSYDYHEATPLSGYDLVADSIAQGRLPPVFRRFKRVNYRVLLQLQDEIIEMEEQLASLDMADTRSRLRPDGSTSPASRRLHWRWNQSDLPAQRLEILGRLYIKIEQYYQALGSAQNVIKTCVPALPTDIESFRTWLREHEPLSPAESKFLDEDDDLISLEGETSLRSNTARSTTPPDLVPVCILTTTLFPLICFKLTTGVLNRLIVLFAVLVAGLGSLEKMDKSRAHEHKQLVVACFSVSFLVALFF